MVELSGGGRREADALIIATPAHEAARLVAPLDAGMQELLGLIPFASTVVIHLALSPGGRRPPARRLRLPHPERRAQRPGRLHVELAEVGRPGAR